MSRFVPLAKDTSISTKIKFICKKLFYKFADQEVIISNGDFTSLGLTKEINDKLLELKTRTSDSFDISFYTDKTLVPYFHSNINYIVPYYYTKASKDGVISYPKNFEINVANSFLGVLFQFTDLTLNKNAITNSENFDEVFETIIKNKDIGNSFFTMTEENKRINVSFKIEGMEYVIKIPFVIIDSTESTFSLTQIVNLTNDFFNSEIRDITNEMYNVSFKGSKLSISASNHVID
jgi:hypothetical protein